MKTCISLWMLIGTVLLLQPASASENADTYRFAKMVNGQQITVLMQIGPFDPKAHQIKYISEDIGNEIDGERPIGNQGTQKAHTEFKRLEVSWNGKTIEL